jgi:hypothetical protein
MEMHCSIYVCQQAFGSEAQQQNKENAAFCVCEQAFWIGSFSSKKRKEKKKMQRSMYASKRFRIVSSAPKKENVVFFVCKQASSDR